ncbi:alpha/beta fold hydrolase [Rhodococcus sp. MEB064]|uniref:alpha/beta fold hydrolase n=1 Tax=Rhodococcus sp. MEB064 TaxID=1587522 RepID=UPI0005AC2F01|nr:alpha/beta hydrolase [Rhodococcus sp. MEB064]KIQ18467.1 alpha/beta hydrolase [Rhodococcus sp. MEB064]
MSEALTDKGTRRIVETPDYKIQINEAGTGHPVILIHGTGPGATGWSNFSPNLPALSQKYRCIAVTMPGWGLSSAQTVDTGRDQVAAILQLMDSLGIDKAAFVGNSMGGAIALQIAAKHPDRMSHLITMGSGLGLGSWVFSPGMLSEGMRVLIETYKDPTPANFKRLVEVMCFDPKNASDELAAERSKAAMEFPQHNQNWLDMWNAPGHDGSWEDVTVALRTSTIPTMAIHGRDDRTVQFEASMRMVSTIPDSRLVLLNRCGHWAQLEHVEEFNRLVDGFISSM